MRARGEIELDATTDNLPQVFSFLEEHLEEVGCPPKAQMQLSVAAEEIFVNIAHYAYAPERGTALVRVEVAEEPLAVTLTFIDHGTPYDPLAREDPDVTLSADEREIGGLGIYMTKNLVDDVAYEYRDGKNILKLKKIL